MTGKGAFLVFLFLIVPRAVACTCVNTPSAREALGISAVVFRGTVLKSDRLPEHREMHGRQRYAVALRVIEYWKGDPGRMVTLYDLDPGTDCMGAEFRVAREYLIFASEEGATDHRLDGISASGKATDSFWYGWTDVLKPGTPMLQPATGCNMGGDLSDSAVRQQLRQLGPGKHP
jgi:hypothetical protein